MVTSSRTNHSIGKFIRILISLGELEEMAKKSHYIFFCNEREYLRFSMMFLTTLTIMENKIFRC